MSILTLSVPLERRGYAFGYDRRYGLFGIILGAGVGGFLNYYYSWRSIFCVSTLLGVVANVMAFRSLHEDGYIHQIVVFLREVYFYTPWVSVQ